MITAEGCEREIQELHEFFVAYYTGRRGELGRLDAALADEFELIHPSGETTARQTVIDGVRDASDSYEPGEFEIDIRNVEPIEIIEDRALVRYEEWQETPAERTGRLSTVYFASHPSMGDDSPALEWRYLQETWLDAPPEAQ